MITPAPTTHYTEALSRGGVRLAEIRSLARAWRPGEPSGAFVDRVREEDILGKATARTIEDYVRHFVQRFCLPSDRPARHLQRLAAPTAPRQVFDDVVFHHLAAKDDLLRDFTVRRYWPVAREGRLSLESEEVRQFLWEAEQDGRIARPWSEAVRKDMPARVLGALAEFGLLGERKAGRRPILRYRPADGTIAYLAHLLHTDGATDASLAEQPSWALFGLERADVWHRLEGLAGEGWFILQRAGQVVRITWRYPSVEEVVDALAGR